jgi:amino acid transporter
VSQDQECTEIKIKIRNQRRKKNGGFLREIFLFPCPYSGIFATPAIDTRNSPQERFISIVSLFLIFFLFFFFTLILIFEKHGRRERREGGGSGESGCGGAPTRGAGFRPGAYQVHGVSASGKEKKKKNPKEKNKEKNVPTHLCVFPIFCTHWMLPLMVSANSRLID